MMIRFFISLIFLSSIVSCHKKTSSITYDNTQERINFYESYNQESFKKTEEKIIEINTKLTTITEETARKELITNLDLLEKRKRDGQFFQLLTEDKLPKNLNWITDNDQPEIGSPNAIKGGTYHTFLPGMAFPPTIRTYGKESNNNFRSYHYDNIEMALCGSHSETGKTIPAIADRWSISDDRQTVYFHINDLAKWSDGKKIVSGDFLMTFYICLSPYLTEPWYRTYYGDQFNGITTYGDHYLSLRLSSPKPRPEFNASITPNHELFYKEFGTDFEERYNWLPRPTTGAYQILPNDIHKGRSLTLSRVQNWWAKDLKYYRNCYNPDRIEYKLIRELDKAFILFTRGDIELFPLGQPKYWYEKTEIPNVFNGYIQKSTFYNEYPRVPMGIYFNQATPLLANQDIRIGLQYSTNWQRVIDFDMRGDANRLHIMNDGFGKFSNHTITTREFSPEKASESFARAGFSQKDSNGILMNTDGERLSFTITYGKAAFVDQMMQRLKEEALKTGVEYKLESLDAAASFQKTSQKKHQIALAGWGTVPPFPTYYEFLHSSDAYEPGTKTPRIMTNNISTYANPQMDDLVEKNRNATDEETIQSTSFRIEELIHEQAIWSPAYKKDFYRVGYWRWLKWPEKFNVRISDDPEMSYVFWIDEKVKKETLEAIKSEKKFPEINQVFDEYRVK
jgi:microcin C transport system substrate-binding protein